jgi:hypothetical protein
VCVCVTHTHYIYIYIHIYIYTYIYIYIVYQDWLTMPNEGKWTHLAGTYDADEGEMKLYINGLFVGCGKT